MRNVMMPRAQDAISERDEAETLGEKRGADLGQRVVNLSAELRAERAATTAIRAASETGKSTGIFNQRTKRI